MEPVLCESCYDAFEEEGAPMDDLAEIIWLGADIADHDCEKTEDDNVECRCPCRRGIK